MLWHDSERLLAQCFCFHIDYDTNIIEAEIKVTSKRALYEFIRLSFKNFSESPLEVESRNKFKEQISECYKALEVDIREEMAKMLPYNDKFYSHQGDTIVEAYHKKYNFLALDRRLGKTIISASLSRLHQCKRTVIISPATAKWNAWYRDLTTKFGFNELYFTILDSRKAHTTRAFMERFVVINYDIVGKFMPELLSEKVDHFIFDECHKIKSKSAQRTKHIKELVDSFPDARITFLSGTPIRNRVDDVFSYLNIIGHELGKSYKKFCDEFTTSVASRGGSRINGGRNLDDLKIKLSNFMIRKRKEDCMDIPKQTFTSYKFELDDYREEYDKIIEELSQQKEISSLTGNVHSLNIITSKAKFKGIVELADEIINAGEKVVIFSNYTAPIEMLENHFKKACVKITGAVPPHKRDSIVEEFKNNPEITVFLGNMEAAGEAINLSVASEIIIVDFPLIPGTLQQAVDRCLEIGKTKDINISYTFCEKSVDEYLYDLIVEKEGDINTVIDGRKESLTFNENIVQKLISKLLNKDVVNENALAGAKESLLAQENNKEAQSDVKKYGFPPPVSPDNKGLFNQSGAVGQQDKNVSESALRILQENAVTEMMYPERMAVKPLVKANDFDLPDFD